MDFDAKLDSPDISLPSSGGSRRHREGPIALAARGTYLADTQRLDLASFTLSSPYGALDASGALQDLGGRRLADLRGNLAPDWDEGQRDRGHVGRAEGPRQGSTPPLPRARAVVGRLHGGHLEGARRRDGRRPDRVDGVRNAGRPDPDRPEVRGGPRRDRADLDDPEWRQGRAQTRAPARRCAGGDAQDGGRLRDREGRDQRRGLDPGALVHRPRPAQGDPGPRVRLGPPRSRGDSALGGRRAPAECRRHDHVPRRRVRAGHAGQAIAHAERQGGKPGPPAGPGGENPGRRRTRDPERPGHRHGERREGRPGRLGGLRPVPSR